MCLDLDTLMNQLKLNVDGTITAKPSPCSMGFETLCTTSLYLIKNSRMECIALQEALYGWEGYFWLKSLTKEAVDDKYLTTLWPLRYTLLVCKKVITPSATKEKLF